MAIPRASVTETAGVVADVVLPLVARGAIVRRPRVVGLLDRADADRRAVSRLQRLRRRHGPGPVLLRLPGRDIAFVLAPEHVHADAFAPGVWLDDGTPDGTPPDGCPFVPFSEGPAACPGRNLVLLVTTTLLATFLAGRTGVRQLSPPPLDPARPLPATLSPFRLCFALF